MRTAPQIRDSKGVWIAGISASGLGGGLRRHLFYLMLRMRSGFYAQAFPTTNGQRVEGETKALMDSLKNHGLRVRSDWLSRYTFGRGGGPGVGPEIVAPVLFAVAFVVGSYAQGFIGQIGAEHSIAIRQTVKEWLERRKSDDFYLSIETATGQQVRALFSNGANFLEAYDALDNALRQLPELPPDGFCLIEWDDNKKRWVETL